MFDEVDWSRFWRAVLYPAADLARLRDKAAEQDVDTFRDTTVFVRDTGLFRQFVKKFNLLSSRLGRGQRSGYRP